MRKCAPSQGKPSGNVTLPLSILPNKLNSAIMHSVNVTTKLTP